MSVEDLTSKCFESSVLTLNNLNWKIQICRQSPEHSNNIGNSLNVSLVYVKTFNSFSCEARAIFKILPVNAEKDNATVKEIKQLFSAAAPIHGVALIDWDTFLDSYVQDGKCTFEVKVSVSPKRKNLGMGSTSTKFRVIINDVEKMNRRSQYITSKFGSGVATWDIWFKINNETLGWYLALTNSDLDMNEWSYSTNFTVVLLPKDENTKPLKVVHRATYEYEGQSTLYTTYNNYISWTNFTKSYVNSNMATFECELEVAAPKPNWNIDETSTNEAITIQ